MITDKSSISAKSNLSDSEQANEENGESEVERLMREAIEVLKESRTDLEEMSTPNTDTGASTPARYSQASNGSGVDFFSELKEKIAHMRNKDEVFFI